MSNLPGPSSISSGLLSALMAWLRHDDTDDSTVTDDEPARLRATCSPAHSALQVLVVDDNPVNQMMLSELLEQRGIVAQLAMDGAEAVEIACARIFDIIFMDVQMPVLDGMAATARIRHFERMQSRQHVPVVAYSSTIIGRRALAASGMDDALAKPCSDAELEACLMRWCPGFSPRTITVRRDASAGYETTPQAQTRTDRPSGLPSAG